MKQTADELNKLSMSYIALERKWQMQQKTLWGISDKTRQMAAPRLPNCDAGVFLFSLFEATNRWIGTRGPGMRWARKRWIGVHWISSGRLIHCFNPGKWAARWGGKPPLQKKIQIYKMLYLIFFSLSIYLSWKISQDIPQKPSIVIATVKKWRGQWWWCNLW